MIYFLAFIQIFMIVYYFWDKQCEKQYQESLFKLREERLSRMETRYWKTHHELNSLAAAIGFEKKEERVVSAEWVKKED